MRLFFSSLKTSLISLILLTILLGIIYPLLMWGIGELLFHREAEGSLFYYQDGKVIGSEWIAQPFSKTEYFHPRPSAAGNNGYDASNSSGSNLGPTSQKLSQALTTRAAQYRSENKLSGDEPIPTDAVTASGSGLDPHISVANALLQMTRIAAARGIGEDTLRDLIGEYTEGATWGIFGEPRINVLRINLALDQITTMENRP